MSPDSQTSLLSCCGAGRKKHYVVLQHSKTEGWAAEQLRRVSGKFSNSCTLRRHLTHAFHPITQVCLQAKQLFWLVSSCRAPGRPDPTFTAGHKRAASLSPPVICAAGSGSTFVPLFWFATNKQSTRSSLQI